MHEGDGSKLREFERNNFDFRRITNSLGLSLVLATTWNLRSTIKAFSVWTYVSLKKKGYGVAQSPHPPPSETIIDIYRSPIDLLSNLYYYSAS